MKVRLKSLRVEIKGTKAKEEHLGSRGKIKGAVGAEGETEIGLRGRNERHITDEKNTKGGNKSCSKYGVK